LPSDWTPNEKRCAAGQTAAGIEANIESAIVVQARHAIAGRTVDGRKVSADQDFPIRLQRNPEDIGRAGAGIGNWNAMSRDPSLLTRKISVRAVFSNPQNRRLQGSCRLIVSTMILIALF